jgi:hypothetical protein
MKNLINKIIDFYVIIVQISFKMTIIPYFLFSEFPYKWTLVTLVNGIIILVLFLFRFKFEIYSIKKILNFSPVLIFFLLILFQLLSGIIKADTNYIVFPIILLFNFIIFIFYLNNLFVVNRLKGNPRQDFLIVFEKLNSQYINFSLFQIILVIVSVILVFNNIIPLLGTNIDHLYPELIGDNVSNGTQYFMTGWSSMLTTRIRLESFNIGTFTGWTHEPHVFTYLTIPTLFFLLSKYYLQKNKVIIVFLLFFVVCILSFSVTSLLAILLVVLLKSITKFTDFLLIIFIVFIFYILFVEVDIPILNNIYDLLYKKLFDDTSSADYTSNKIMQILIPQSAFGDGVLLLSNNLNKSAGIISSLLYMTFYSVLIIKIYSVINSKNYKFSLIGMGFMYFFLHGFKLSSSVFVMPYTVYMLTLFTIFYIHIFKNNKNENFTSY